MGRTIQSPTPKYRGEQENAANASHCSFRGGRVGEILNCGGAHSQDNAGSLA